MLARIIAHQNEGPNAAMPFFAELVQDPSWPIFARDSDFQEIANEGLRAPQRSTVRADVLQPSRQPHQSLLHLIKLAELTVRDEIIAALRHLDLSPEHFLALGTLSDMPGLTNADMARLLSRTPQSTLNLLAPLVDRGLVARRESGRRIELRLTNDGERLLADGKAAISPIEDRASSHISSDHQSIIRPALNDIIDGSIMQH